MRKILFSRWSALVIANTLIWIGISTVSGSRAQERTSAVRQTNPGQQRAEIRAELAAIRKLLIQQNELLSSGKLKVLVSETK